jgi:ribosome-binding protein aMBF1 (putative translation factor)
MANPIDAAFVILKEKEKDWRDERCDLCGAWGAHEVGTGKVDGHDTSLMVCDNCYTDEIEWNEGQYDDISD